METGCLNLWRLTVWIFGESSYGYTMYEGAQSEWSETGLSVFIETQCLNVWTLLSEYFGSCYLCLWTLVWIFIDFLSKFRAVTLNLCRLIFRLWRLTVCVFEHLPESLETQCLIFEEYSNCMNIWKPTVWWFGDSLSKSLETHSGSLETHSESLKTAYLKVETHSLSECSCC